MFEDGKYPKMHFTQYRVGDCESNAQVDADRILGEIEYFRTSESGKFLSKSGNLAARAGLDTNIRNISSSILYRC